MLGVDAEMIREARICGAVASSAVAPSASSTAPARGLHRRGRARVDLQVAELALDHQDPGLHVGVLERDVGERLDVQARRDLDDLRGHVGARQAAPIQVPEVAHRLRLQLVEEDEGAQLGHGQPL